MNYRKIYEENYGSIPVDECGRTYEIHHKDGNRQNNNIDNLVALTIDDHYNIHYERGDWNACLAISMRMNKSTKEISKIQTEIGRKSALKRKEEGINPFCKTGKDHPRYGMKHTEETKRKISEKRALQIMPNRNDLKELFSKKWVVIYPNGERKQVENLKEFCENNNLFYATMNKIGNGYLKSHRGFRCEKLGE